MAIQHPPYKADLVALFKEMEAAPMSIEDYADKFSKITDTQILTGEVTEGISVSTGGQTITKGQIE